VNREPKTVNQQPKTDNRPLNPMTATNVSRALSAALISMLALATVGACTDKSKHASDGDTGAAAPATVRDMSATPNAGDSTAGVSNPTGQPSSPGDTLGARARDSSKGPAAGSPAGAPAGSRP
jgi:hypothetical protein